MPEGDTVYRTARNLSAALTGAELTRCDLRVPRFATVDLTGQRVDEVVSRGKHLLIRVGDSTLHSHLKMEGSWHLYKHGSRWRRPAFEARAVLETAEWQAVGFALGMLEVLSRDEEADAVGYLGPDLLGPDWDGATALRNLRSRPERPIGAALLDQRNLAGIGTLYDSETLFILRQWPWQPVGELDDAALAALLERARRLLDAGRRRGLQNTTGDTRRGEGSYVHGRSGRPCRRCGQQVRVAMIGEPPQERTMFYCPRCQGGLAPTDDGRPQRPLGATAR